MSLIRESNIISEAAHQAGSYPNVNLQEVGAGSDHRLSNSNGVVSISAVGVSHVSPYDVNAQMGRQVEAEEVGHLSAASR